MFNLEVNLTMKKDNKNLEQSTVVIKIKLIIILVEWVYRINRLLSIPLDLVRLLLRLSQVAEILHKAIRVREVLWLDKKVLQV
jgi:hypothetical protein